MPDAFDLRNQLQAALGDAYQIERELGGGGMSRVFVARDAGLKRDVVVKVLEPDLAGGVSLDRFRREVEVAARLQHPNIVPLLAAGDAAGLPYYSMPLVDGESLRARLERAGELPVRDAIAILRDVARALAYAHAHGVVHRDIKPDNVLLSGDYAVVTDFGVAKAISDARRDDAASSALTAMGTALGTPAYMAPEQAAGDPAADHRADIYAFGVMAYEMLAGVPPFSARSAQAMMAAHAMETPTPLATRRSATPPALAELVMRCLEKRPSDRPQTADDVLRALDAASMTIVSGATATGVAASPARPSRSAMRSVLTVVTLVVLMAAAGGVARRFIGSRVAPLDKNLIAVVPFRVTSPDPILRSLREGMLDLVAAKLTGTVRTVDTRTALAVWHRAGGSDASDVEERKAVDAMRATGAGKMLQGDILQTAAGVTIHGTLIDLSSSARVDASASGTAAAVPALVDSVVAKLLLKNAGESEQTASMLASIPFAALQAYVAGQSAYRAGRYQDATDAFARAVGADSAFGLAGLRLYQASLWSLDRRGAAGRALAERYPGQLGAVDRLLLPARDDDGSCAARFVRDEASVREAPDVPELWYQLADHLTHCGLAMGLDRDGAQRALAGFNRALALDSSFTPAREHLAYLYTVLGDSAAARRDLANLPDTSDFLAFNQLLVSTDPKILEHAVAAVEHQPVMSTTLTAIALVGFSPAPSIAGAERLLAAGSRSAATEADRRAVAAATEFVALARGQPRRAADAARAAGEPPAVSLLNAVFSDGDSNTAVQALPLVRRSAAIPPADSSAQSGWVTAAFAAAEYDIATGHVSDSTTRTVAALRTFSGTPRETSRARRFALLLDAQSAVLSKQSDAGRLVAAVDSMLKRVGHGAFNESAGNLIAARLWERLGDAQRAYAATKRIEINATPVPFMATYVRERARLAGAAGDLQDAVTQYRKYVAIRADPEPALIPDRDAAKRELVRLEKLTTGK